MLEKVLQYAEYYRKELKTEQVAATPNEQGFVCSDCC
jgi:hypothetical protein